MMMMSNVKMKEVVGGWVYYTYKHKHEHEHACMNKKGKEKEWNDG